MLQLVPNSAVVQSVVTALIGALIGARRLRPVPDTASRPAHESALGRVLLASTPRPLRQP